MYASLGLYETHRAFDRQRGLRPTLVQVQKTQLPMRWELMNFFKMQHNFYLLANLPASPLSSL
jgi:hypothetical protein